MSDLNESIDALEAFSAQIIEAETDVKADEEESKLSFEFDSAEEAEKMAEKIGCTGSHAGRDGLFIPCSTEEAFQVILADEKAAEEADVEVKDVDRDDAAGTRSMIEGIIDLANSDGEPAKAAAAKMEFDSEDEAVLAAEVLKCSGVHSHSEGKFMPCVSHEVLLEAVEGFEAPAEAEDMNPEKSEDVAEVEVKTEEATEEIVVDAEAEVETEEAIVVDADVDADADADADAEAVEEKSADDLLSMMDVKTEEESEESATEVAVETEVKSEELVDMMEPAEEAADEEEISEIAAIEALAAKSAGEGAEVINSGYSPADDTYVIDVKTADETIREYFYSSAGEEKGYLVVEAAASSEDFISEEAAASIATEYKSGEVVSVEPGLILGTDAFVVEIDEVEGKSYDVFVSLKGEILGHDEYEMAAESSHGEDELAEIKALEAELEIKRMYNREKREELAESGEAMEDGSFPIVDEADLKNAIQAHGRASDIEAAKQHIIKRAKALGLEAVVPTDWDMAPKEDAEAEEKALEISEDVDEKATAILETAEVAEVTEEEIAAVEVLEADDAMLAEFADLMRDI